MRDITHLGRHLYVVAIAALGIQACLCAKVIFELEPVPAWVPGQTAIASLTGIALVAIATGLLLERIARIAAIALAALLVLWVLALHVPLLIPDPAPDLSFAFETVALAAMAWALAVGPANAGATQSARADAAASLWYARGAMSASLIAFCAVNFIYTRGIAAMIPGWIPAHRFWAYFTGIASLAAAVSVISGVQARLALVLLGVMYGSWVLIIHIPYLAAHPDDRDMWTDGFITLALAGGSWLLSGAIPCPARAAEPKDEEARARAGRC